MDMHLCTVFSIRKRKWVLPLDLHLIWGETHFFEQHAAEQVCASLYNPNGQGSSPYFQKKMWQIRDELSSLSYIRSLQNKTAPQKDIASSRQEELNSDEATVTKFTFTNCFGGKCTPGAWTETLSPCSAARVSLSKGQVVQQGLLMERRRWIEEPRLSRFAVLCLSLKQSKEV